MVGLGDFERVVGTLRKGIVGDPSEGAALGIRRENLDILQIIEWPFLQGNGDWLYGSVNKLATEKGIQQHTTLGSPSHLSVVGLPVWTSVGQSVNSTAETVVTSAMKQTNPERIDPKGCILSTEMQRSVW